MNRTRNGTRAWGPLLGALGIAILSGCGATTSGGGTAGCTGSVALGSDEPTGGSDASDAVPTENGSRLAVEQATAKNLLGGCTINFIPKNDSSVALGKHDPQQGAANMTEFAANAAVVGVVGPFNSNVGKVEAPIANNAGLTMISAVNTNPGLTIEGSNPDVDTKSLRPAGKLTYFRVCTTDIGQGRALAQVASDTLKAKKAFVIDDQETYGKGLADQFLKYYTQAGGTKVDRVSEPGTKKDFRDDLNKAKQEGADLIFFGGTSSNGGGIIRKDMVSALPDAKYLGGDGIVDAEFFTEAGPAGDGSYGTIAAPDPTKLDSAKQFVSDYRAKFGADPGAYSANAYDAMNILIQAVKKAIDDNGGKIPADPKALRESVRKNVAATAYDGAIGHTSFDQNGDTSNILITLDKGAGGKWVFDQTLQLKAG
ncbi:MAG: branched-chain amino acid ABC transporter substrate-binding protein [Actinobacteria bacterium]|nr:branched-chain amino acid ABC transporter substrate-binding protein [Actinomycetota bacterium]